MASHGLQMRSYLDGGHFQSACIDEVIKSIENKKIFQIGFWERRKNTDLTQECRQWGGWLWDEMWIHGQCSTIYKWDVIIFVFSQPSSILDNMQFPPEKNSCEWTLIKKERGEIGLLLRYMCVRLLVGKWTKIDRMRMWVALVHHSVIQEFTRKRQKMWN